jgi:hypothetical protein
MRDAARGVGTLFVAVGAAVVALGVVLLGWSLLAPTQPPPSLNEGHGLGFFFGIVTGFVGLAVIAIGKSIGGAGKPQAGGQAAQPGVEPDGPSARGLTP